MNDAEVKLIEDRLFGRIIKWVFGVALAVLAVTVAIATSLNSGPEGKQGKPGKSADNDFIAKNLAKDPEFSAKIIEHINVDTVFTDEVLNSLVLVIHKLSTERARDCPKGWKRWESADGLFLRAYDPQKIVDIDERSNDQLGSIQQDAVIKHSHPLGEGGVVLGTNGILKSGAKYDGGSKHDFYGYNTTRGFGESHETRPKNISVLLCVIDNS